MVTHQTNNTINGTNNKGIITRLADNLYGSLLCSSDVVLSISLRARYEDEIMNLLRLVGFSIGDSVRLSSVAANVYHVYSETAQREAISEIREVIAYLRASVKDTFPEQDGASTFHMIKKLRTVQ